MSQRVCSLQRSEGCRAQPRQVDGSYCIKGSVFSEALDAPVTIVIFFAALRWALFEIFDNQPITDGTAPSVQLLRVRPQGERSCDSF
eukprot:scaffold9384_cov70-Skeletonema_dohrnii-CCMP3373.AAC.3